MAREHGRIFSTKAPPGILINVTSFSLARRLPGERRADQFVKFSNACLSEIEVDLIPDHLLELTGIDGELATPHQILRYPKGNQHPDGEGHTVKNAGSWLFDQNTSLQIIIEAFADLPDHLGDMKLAFGANLRIMTFNLQKIQEVKRIFLELG